ncbi:hypothetical protein BZG36_03167 [Bifiguratus adelaidae]|uniref:Uncharacterized protein n=1 Tax=Bifiguratus adelaidae TaxID=1938954 RepID=A0A261Y145_9FUNG|nr:hypothetical protein BZG36_03167 [Bifiguratus adelaidae]
MKTFTFVSLAALVAVASAQNPITGYLTDASNFCLWLPPQPGMGTISDNEWQAQAFCTTPSSEAPGAHAMPSGFIQSAHFVSGTNYVQVTGQINPTVYGMQSTDYGGQMDPRAPTGAVCAGYAGFVSLIEPATATYCIRCCNGNWKDNSLCGTGRSQDGCAVIVPGDYSGPFDLSSMTGSSAANTTQPAAIVASSSASPSAATGASSVAGSASAAFSAINSAMSSVGVSAASSAAASSSASHSASASASAGMSLRTSTAVLGAGVLAVLCAL